MRVFEGGADDSSNHTQSTAYLVGETAAEKIIDEYQLDGETQRL